MIINLQEIKIYLKPGSTDMRKQINGLAEIIQEETDLNIFSGSLYLFCSKDRTRLKILYWDKNGFCLWLKRLEQDKFPWPRHMQEVRELSPHELKMLLSGIDFFHAHKRLHYKET